MAASERPHAAVVAPSSRLLLALNDYKYYPTAQLGCGSFGQVFSAYCSLRAEDVAVKAISLGFAAKPPRSDAEKLVSVSAIEQEIVSAQRLRHPNVIGFIDRFLANGQICLVMELATRGNLRTVAVTYRTLRLRQIPIVFQQIVDGVGYLHGQGTHHGALHCENVLFQENALVKLTDFGLPHTRLNARQSGISVGAAPGEPPETRVNRPYDRVKADMWGIGRLLYAAASGLPYIASFKLFVPLR